MRLRSQAKQSWKSLAFRPNSLFYEVGVEPLLHQHVVTNAQEGLEDCYCCRQSP